jgi:hypothetical protein
VRSPGHRRIARLLDAHVDGELQVGPQRRVIEHASRCADCRDGLTLTRQIKTSLTHLGTQRPPEVVTRRLHRFAEELARG